MSSSMKVQGIKRFVTLIEIQEGNTFINNNTKQIKMEVHDKTTVMDLENDLAKQLGGNNIKCELQIKGKGNEFINNYIPYNNIINFKRVNKPQNTFTQQQTLPYQPQMQIVGKLQSQNTPTTYSFNLTQQSTPNMFDPNKKQQEQQFKPSSSNFNNFNPNQQQQNQSVPQQFQKEIDTLKQRIENLTQQIQQKDNLIFDYENEKNQLKQENKQQKYEIEQLKQTISQLQNQLNSYNQNGSNFNNQQQNNINQSCQYQTNEQFQSNVTKKPNIQLITPNPKPVIVTQPNQYPNQEQLNQNYQLQNQNILSSQSIFKSQQQSYNQQQFFNQEINQHKCGKKYQKNELENKIMQSISTRTQIKCDQCYEILKLNFLRNLIQLDLFNYYSDSFLKIQVQELEQTIVQNKGKCRNTNCNFFCIWSYNVSMVNPQFGYCPNCSQPSVISSTQSNNYGNVFGTQYK